MSTPNSNTPPKIGIPERVEIALAAMVKCVLADSRQPKSLLGGWMITVTALGNIALHFAMGMKFTIPCRTGPEPEAEAFSSHRCQSYAVATTNISKCLAGEKTGIVPHNFKEATTLQAKVQWKTVSDEVVGSLKITNILTLLPACSVFSGNKILCS